MKTIRTKLMAALAGCLLTALPSVAVTNDLATALQKGLFEEEANHNLDAAIQAYQSIAAQFDKDRKLAATAIFRLGECYRKEGKTNEANAQYERVLREFPDQAPLVTLSRQNIAMPSGPTVAPSPPGVGGSFAERLQQIIAQSAISSETAEIQRLQALIKDSPDLINAKDSTGKTPLHNAVSAKMVAVVEFLLANGADREVKDNSGDTPLHYATSAGNKAMVELLLSKGAKVQPAGNSGNTPLHLAAQKGFLGISEVLLAHGADINARDEKDRTPLHKAVANGFKSVVELLLAHGANVNAVSERFIADGEGFSGTPLHIAVQRRYQMLIDLLLAHKADVNAFNSDGKTPLHIAAEMGSIPIATALLSNGAKVNASMAQKPGWTSLVSAVEGNQKGMVAFLLKNKADPNVRFDADLSGYIPSPRMQTTLGSGSQFQNTPVYITTFSSQVHKGNTPLLLATGRGYAEIIESLLSSKANPNLKSDDGRVPISNVMGCSLPAAERDRLVSLLLDHGAEVDVTTADGITPLMDAAASGNKELVELLMAHKANPNAKSKEGLSALHYATAHASEGRRTEIAELLLAAGADINALDNNGKTPLNSVPNASQGSSAAKNIAEFTDLLRKHGAVEQMPDFTTIRLTRKGLDQPIVVFHKDTNGLNSFTLLEAIRNYYYGLLLLSGTPTVSMLDRGMLLPFPDLRSIHIHRPVPGKPGEERMITIVLPIDTNSIACEKNVPLEFGDVVEIPEREHSLAEPRVGLTMQQQKELETCLARKVAFVTKGERAEITLFVVQDAFLSTALKTTPVQAILRSSSDLTRVRITRTDSETKKTKQIIENVLPFWKSKESVWNDLWLRDGDVVEVPEKP